MLFTQELCRIILQLLLSCATLPCVGFLMIAPSPGVEWGWGGRSIVSNSSPSLIRVGVGTPWALQYGARQVPRRHGGALWGICEQPGFLSALSHWPLAPVSSGSFYFVPFLAVTRSHPPPPPPHFGGAQGMGVTTEKAQVQDEVRWHESDRGPISHFLSFSIGSGGPMRGPGWSSALRPVWEILSGEVARRVLQSTERAQNPILVCACGWEVWAEELFSRWERGQDRRPLPGPLWSAHRAQMFRRAAEHAACKSQTLPSSPKLACRSP